MGYYTSFTMSVDKNEEAVAKYIDDADDRNLHYVFQDVGDNDWYGNSKWYDHDEDMRALSAVFPDVLFTLTGEGEEAGDIWRKWYREGKRIDAWKADVQIPEHPFSTTHLED